MPKFECASCGVSHNDLPMDIGYRLPAAYFAIPEQDLEKRVVHTDDTCIIDGIAFFIRGILPIPVPELDNTFCFGPWAQISKSDFDRYRKYFDINPHENEPALTGQLSGNLIGYENSDGIRLDIVLQKDGQRPVFNVVDQEIRLYADQQNGVDVATIHQWIARLFPDFFDN